MSDQIVFHRERPVKEFNINQTMYSMVTEQNKNNLDAVAIEYFGTKISFGKLFRDANRLADAYEKAGLQEGDCVAIITINLPAVQENLLALSKIGVISKWIDVRLKEKDLVEKLNENKCRIAVVFDEIANNVISILSQTDVEKVLVVSPKDYLSPAIKFLSVVSRKKEEKDKEKVNFSDKILRYREFLETGSNNSKIDPVPFQKDRTGLIIQSSGSTGKSKSIVHTEYNMNSEMKKEAYSDLPFADEKRMHVSVPPFIIYGLCNSIYAALAFSMTSVMTPYVRAEAIFDDLGKFDFACGAPFHFRYIYDKISVLQNEISLLKEDTGKKNSSELRQKEKELKHIYNGLDKVTAFICGGDKISPQELLTMEHTFNTPIINGYGNNEMCGASIISPVYAMKPNATGIPMKGVEVHAFSVEDNTRLPKNTPGEICMTSDSIFVEYVNNPEETRKIKQVHADGREWIHTGDVGYIDDDGFVFITGRTKRLIKMDGFKIAPETIESVVLGLEEIKIV